MDVEVHRVLVDARVHDRRGGFVAGLGRADFELLVDGKEREIDDVLEVRHEATPAPAGKPAPATAVTPAPQPPADDPASRFPRRLVVVLDLQSGIGVRARHEAAKWLARELKEGDRVTVATVVWGLHFLVRDEAYTPRIAALIERSQFSYETGSLGLAALDQEFLSGGGKVSSGISLQKIQESVAGEGTRAAYSLAKSLATLGETLADEPGPKTILLFSDGPRVPPGDLLPFYSFFGSQVVRKLAAASATIYAIESHGPTSGTRAEDRGVGRPFVPPPMGANPGNDVLHFAANETGGHHFYNTWDFPAVLDRVSTTTSSFYLLSFVPDDAPRGGYHKILVRVRRPGLEIGHRLGYLDPATSEAKRH